MRNWRNQSAWDVDAACYGHDDDEDLKELVELYDEPSYYEFFYPPRDPDLYHEYAAIARDFCFGQDGRHPCPVQRECLLWAIDRDEEHGIWGGLSHRERNALRRKADAAGLTVEKYLEREDANGRRTKAQPRPRQVPERQQAGTVTPIRRAVPADS